MRFVTPPIFCAREGSWCLPTETVYGAAGLLTDPKALTRLKALRGSDEGKPFTIHLANREDASNYLSPTERIRQAA